MKPVWIAKVIRLDSKMVREMKSIQKDLAAKEDRLTFAGLLRRLLRIGLNKMHNELAEETRATEFIAGKKGE